MQHIQTSDTIPKSQSELLAPCPFKLLSNHPASECITLLEPSPLNLDFTQPYRDTSITLLPDGETYAFHILEDRLLTPPVLAEGTIHHWNNNKALVRGEVHILLGQHYVLWFSTGVMTIIICLMLILNNHFGLGFSLMTIIIGLIGGNIWMSIRQQKRLVSYIRGLLES